MGQRVVHMSLHRWWQRQPQVLRSVSSSAEACEVS
jgi:hypothetical protein